MLELLCMSLLGVAYVNACIEERRELERKKKEEELMELKLTIFCYAVRHHLLYNDVVTKIEHNELSLEDIRKDGTNGD